jgi:hypothetical protein
MYADFTFTHRRTGHRALPGDDQLQLIKQTLKERMKLTTTITTIALWALATAAQANLGDTYKQSCWRYGKPAGRDSETGEVIWWLNKDFSVQASFGDPGDRCDGIRYGNWSATKVWNEGDIRTLIGFNMKAVWQETPAVYGRAWTGGDRTALLMTNNPSLDDNRHAYILGVFTASCAQRYNAKHPQESTATDQAPDINSLPDVAKPNPTPEGHRELEAPKETQVKWLVGPDSKDLPHSLV